MLESLGKLETQTQPPLQKKNLAQTISEISTESIWVAQDINILKVPGDSSVQPILRMTGLGS